jgi:hypothetical protein
VASDLEDIGGPFERAAARTRRRAPTREPDPLSLIASQGGVPWSAFLPSEERALASAGALQRGEDYNPRDVFLSAIGAVGTPGGVPLGALGSSIGRRPPITATSLRQMPLDDAIKIARSEAHIIPKKEGGFVGAPYWVQDADTLAKMRADFDADVAAGLHGSDWYLRAQKGNLEMAGPDPARQHLLAGEQALWSAQSTPDTNLGFLLTAHNAYEAGKPLDLVRTGQQARTYQKARDTGTSIPLGEKTDPYGQHLDPTRESPTTGTNDIWHARALGYRTREGEPWSTSLTSQQHAFMDAETVLAVDRANKMKLGGRDNWTAGEIQAAPWIKGKAIGLMEQFGWSEEKAMSEAVKTYNDYFDKYTAHGTYEATPGIGTGHLPNLPTAPYAERAAFAADPRSSWTGSAPGRDVIYDALGMYQRPTTQATGIYQSPGGPLEINPAQVARPMVGLTGETGARQIDPASRAMMTGGEAARAYIDAQNAGAFSMPIRGQKKGLSTSLAIPTDQPLTLSQIGSLRDLGAKAGLGDVVDYGRGAVMTSFYPGPPTLADLGKSMKGGLAADIERVAGVKPEGVKMDAGYIGYEEALKKPGSGEATKILEQALTSPEAPAMLAKLDKDTALRAKVLDRLNRDAEYAAKTGQPVREDIQRAREIISKSGFSGLFEARKAGVSLPALAALAPVVSYLRGDRGE